MLESVILLLLITSLLLLWSYVRTDKLFVVLGNKIPGPPGLPVLGNLFTVPTTGPESLKFRRKIIKEYGHVTRLWFGNILFVFLSDAKDCEVVLRDTKNIDKSSLYNFLHPWLGTGILTSTGKKWHIRRKAITPTFHFKILEEFIEIFNKNGNILINCLRNHCNGDAFDIHPYISRFTLDIICETAMGTEVSAQINHNSTYVSAVRRMCDLINNRMKKTWLHNPIIYYLLGRRWEEDRLIKILHAYTNEVIKEKTKYLSEDAYQSDSDEGIKTKKAFLEFLLKMKMSGNPAFQSDDDVSEEVNTFMFEGHDTTKSAICFTLILLSNNREVQEQVYGELLDLMGSQAECSYDTLQKMKYLECVIKESLRLFPSVPVIGREINEDLQIPSGYTIPAGTVLLLSLNFLHRNEKYFHNPEKFNPDNFLYENSLNRHPYAFLPFSAGPRNCIGQKFAMLELKSVLSKIIFNYIIEPAEDSWGLVEDPNIVLQSLSGHKLKLTQRLYNNSN